MNYYVLEFDFETEHIVDEKIPAEFSGISMNLGISMENLPPICLTVNATNLPDCLPNYQRYLYFNTKLQNLLRQAGFTHFQSFEIQMEDQSGNKLYTGH